MTAEELKAMLGLEPLPAEGGYYAETYRSPLYLPADALPAAYTGTRHASTAIYYLLTPDTFSALHRLPGDEVYHFYLGDPIDLVELHADGRATTTRLGPDLRAGQRVQHVVAGGTWQGSRLARGGAWALLGTTMAPGFDFADFEPADADALARQYPAYAEWIDALTR